MLIHVRMYITEKVMLGNSANFYVLQLPYNVSMYHITPHHHSSACIVYVHAYVLCNKIMCVCVYFPQPITVGSLLEQPLVYEVYYNGTMQNVSSPTTMLTFTAPPLPDGVFSGNITVTVTAINRFGRGMPSDPEDSLISSLNHMYIICIIYVRIINCAVVNNKEW